MSSCLESLRFVALSAAVHADAVQCLADDTRRALSQMAVDSDHLEALEAQLTDLLQKQQRLHALRDAVSRARRERSEQKTQSPQSTAALPSKPRGLAVAPASAVGSGGSSMKQVLQFASSAVEKDDILPTQRHLTQKALAGCGRPSATVSRGRETGVSRYCDSATGGEHGESDDGGDAERTLDEEVERVKAEIRRAEAMSIGKKLRDLEALKQQMNGLDVNSLVGRYVEPFTFPMEVEELWRGNNVVNGENVNVLLGGACDRFTSRYEDALGAISDFPLSETSEAARVYGSTLYAEQLSSPHNYDAAIVQMLEQSDRSALARFTRRMQRLATVCVPLEKRAVDTVLGPAEFTFLPTDWPTTKMLLPKVREYLPPAKHIMTPRFTYANAEELKSLQSLRVEIQRELAAAFSQLPKVLDEVVKPDELQRNSVEYKAALARLLEAERKGSSAIWTTLARECQVKGP